MIESLTLIEGGSVEVSVKAVGSEPLAYQWSKGGEKIDGATHPTLPLAKAMFEKLMPQHQGAFVFWICQILRMYNNILMA